jgi:hypothetical protein
MQSAIRADDADTPFCWASRTNDLLGDVSNLTPISSSISPVNTCILGVPLLSRTEPVPQNLFHEFENMSSCLQHANQ